MWQQLLALRKISSKWVWQKLEGGDEAATECEQQMSAPKE